MRLKFFFITLAVVSAGAYFFIAIIDSKEQMIAGLREVEAEQVYNFQSLNGLMAYARDLVSTYLNSLYYSIVVMATLGDSTITAHGGLTRVIVAFEVATALSLTVFKIGGYYGERATLEAKQSESRIIRELQNVGLGRPCQPLQTVDPAAGWWERLFTRL